MFQFIFAEPNDCRAVVPVSDVSPSSSTDVVAGGGAASASASASAGGGSNGGFLSGCRLELLEPTHRGLHRFVPRHDDEIEVDIGDPVYVQREADDLWCEGENTH